MTSDDEDLPVIGVCYERFTVEKTYLAKLKAKYDTDDVYDAFLQEGIDFVYYPDRKAIPSFLCQVDYGWHKDGNGILFEYTVHLVRQEKGIVKFAIVRKTALARTSCSCAIQ